MKSRSSYPGKHIYTPDNFGKAGMKLYKLLVYLQCGDILKYTLSHVEQRRSKMDNIVVKVKLGTYMEMSASQNRRKVRNLRYMGKHSCVSDISDTLKI